MTDSSPTRHGEWSSRFAFILAATGSAVGLGNIWKFPYITGENGGGAFVLVYLLCVVLLGIPIMMTEILIGRHGGLSPINTLKNLATEASADARWQWLGWMGISAGFLILSYYSVIAGWAMAYAVKGFFGQFSGSDATTIQALFSSLQHSPAQQLFWHTAFMGLTLWIVGRGVKGGLEWAVRWLMPALFIILILLVAYAMSSGAYQQGLHFLFYADFSKITADVVLTAMGHAFFTLSLGMGAIMVYGAYLPKSVSISQTTCLIAVADTAVALLAGIAIFPLVFANQLAPSAGPGLIFQTLPLAFGQMPGGWLFGVLFFVLLVLAALTSSISLIEPTVAWLIERYDIDRPKACIWAGVPCWLLGVVVVFSFNHDGKLFESLDYLTANIMLPLGGMGIAVFAGWCMKQQTLASELKLSDALFAAWHTLIRYLAPAAVFLVFLHVVGIL